MFDSEQIGNLVKAGGAGPREFKSSQMEEDILRLKRVSERLLVVFMESSLGVLDVEDFSFRVKKDRLPEDTFFFDCFLVEKRNELVLVKNLGLRERSCRDFEFSIDLFDLDSGQINPDLFASKFFQYAFFEDSSRLLLIDNEHQIFLSDFSKTGQKLEPLASGRLIKEENELDLVKLVIPLEDCPEQTTLGLVVQKVDSLGKVDMTEVQIFVMKIDKGSKANGRWAA